MRSIVFRFGNIAALADALEEARGALTLPEGETVFDGEWVLAIFEIGSRRRATAAAARAVRAAGDPHLAFERRDWDRLTTFVAVRSEHVRAAKPSSESQAPNSSAAIAPESLAPSSTSLDDKRVPSGARILLVEADAETRKYVQAMLADVGLSVEGVENAEEANVRMRASTFDALVLDFHAPRTASLEFVRGIRKDPSKAPLPVLFLSDRPSSRDVVDAFAVGADDVLPKPFRAPELAARIFGLLRRAKYGVSVGARP